MRAFSLVPASSLAALFVFATGAATAQTRTSQFAVRANVQKDCQVTTLDLDFGTYRSDAVSNGQTPLQVRCTPATYASVSLNGGSSGNPQQRTMLSGTYKLNYQLYRDAAHQDPINTNGQAFQIPAESNTGQVVTFTIYGQIPSAQTVAAGNYVDTIQVTVQF
ncbi:MAG TPA: spore coat U domain-containing protein [Hyphomonadaceae bacterium]|nr:spore coat U domain-containing protein [Hyphomonadaceae bacterium]